MLALRYTEYLPHIGTSYVSIYTHTDGQYQSPKNQTAAMQLLQLYAQSGHYYWTADVVLRSKLERFIEKLEVFRINRDAPGRVYDKMKGLASVHLVILDSADGLLPWVLVSSHGRGGLADGNAPLIGQVRDTRLAGQHLVWKHYELLYAEKRMTRFRSVTAKEGEEFFERKETIRQTTWSWRILPAQWKAHEAYIVSLVKQHNTTGLMFEMKVLAMMPQFAGVRGQVLKLYAEAKKLARKFKLNVPKIPELPYMVRLPVYTLPPATLLTIQSPVLVRKVENIQNF